VSPKQAAPALRDLANGVRMTYRPHRFSDRWTAMSKLSPKLRKLDRALLDIDNDHAMTLSEFDGFCAGLLVSPDLIAPDEWLPWVWGEDEDGEPVLANLDEAEHLIRMLTDHYNDVVAMLLKRQGDYAAIFDVDTRHDEWLWEIWIEGFETAMRLRPESWATMFRQMESDEDAAAAFSCLIALIEIAQDESELPEATIEEMTQSAAGLIPGLVETLYDWRMRRDQGPLAAPPSRSFTGGKVGRNDPCPCGSGKKYKKCCGLN
jgi:uncharacterized protein